MNVVALQRDVLKERRDHIRSEHTLSMERGEDLLEIRKQMQIVDSKWMSIRWKEEIDLRCRPSIASDERRRMIVGGQMIDDWEQRNDREPNGQWQILESAGFITPRPAPGVDEEGNTSDDGSLGREEFVLGNVSRASAMNPVTPPSTKARPKYRTKRRR